MDRATNDKLHPNTNIHDSPSFSPLLASRVSLLQNFDQKKSQTTAILFFSRTDRPSGHPGEDRWGYFYPLTSTWSHKATHTHTQKALTWSGMTQGWPHLFGFTMTMFLLARPHTRGQRWKKKCYWGRKYENGNMTYFTGYCLLRKLFLTHFSECLFSPLISPQFPIILFFYVLT